MRTRRILRGAGAAGLALALTACMKMDMDLEINTDDTIDGTIVMAFSKDFMDMAGMMGEDADMDNMFDEFMDFGQEGEDTPDYASFEPYDDGDFIGQQVNMDGAPLEDFTESTDMSTLSITREGEEFVVQGNMDMSDETGDMGEIPPGMLENMDFDLRVSITFPGEVLETNGSVDGTTVTWVPEIGETNEMHARSLDSGGAGGGMPVWLWILIGVVVVAGLAALLFLLSRNKSEPAPVGTGAETPPADAGVAAPPPPAPAEPGPAPAAQPPGAPETPMAADAEPSERDDVTEMPEPPPASEGSEPPEEPR